MDGVAFYNGGRIFAVYGVGRSRLLRVHASRKDLHLLPRNPCVPRELDQLRPPRGVVQGVSWRFGQFCSRLARECQARLLPSHPSTPREHPPERRADGPHGAGVSELPCARIRVLAAERSRHELRRHFHGRETQQDRADGGSVLALPRHVFRRQDGEHGHAARHEGALAFQESRSR